MAVVPIQPWRTAFAAAADVADDRTGDVANADTPDSAAMPETSRTLVHGRAHEETTLGYASVDILCSDPPRYPGAMQASLQYPVQRYALLR